MRLKALEMQGFKSFPDKTRLDFNNGITVVVGPNGSGKSNITDAVRWVLGEMSTKNIRGSKMEDVIFGGSDNRRPMGYAEVTLIIDNTTGIGQLESEYDEVSVTRRFFRNGDSEYLINGKAARLRDITELFMNTGVGKTGYSNIGQGKISEIISQKSDERRSVFEEAAGITKYRARKTEAERKLKETEANLLRLGDILSELSTRVGPLEKEANTARKYLDLYEQKKAVDVSLWLYDAENMRNVANETERAYMAAKLELEAADGDISALEARSEQLYQKAAESQTRAEEISEKVSCFVSERHNIESSSKVLENDILHTESRIETTAEELKSKRLSLESGKNRSAELEVQLKEARENLAVIDKSIEELLTESAKRNEASERAEEKILECEDNEKLTEAELVDLRVKLSALEGSHEAESGRHADIEEQIALCDSELALLNNALKSSEQTVKSYSDAIEAENKEKLAAEDEISALTARIDEEKEKLSSLRLTVDTKNHRAENLRKMDELLEGYSYSVKNVMHAYENGRIKGICGPVSKVIRVDKAHSIAIETALGANIQNIITDNEESAKAAIAFLKSTNGGRATFYPITSVKNQGTQISPSDLSKHKGYVGMADTLCDYDSKYSGVIGYLLGRTAVFDSIDSAAPAAKAFGYRIRIVTLDGQLINAGGSFTGGSVKSDSGILTRNAEISAIKDEITRLELDCKKLELSISQMNEELSKLKNTQNAAIEKSELMSALLRAEQTQYEVCKSKIESQQGTKETLLASLDGIGAEHQHYDLEHKRITEAIQICENELEQAKEKTQRAIDERNASDDIGAELIAKYNARLIEKTGAEKDIESFENSMSLSAGTVAALEEQIQRSEELINALGEKLEKARKTISENKVSFTALDSDIIELEKERRDLISKGLELEKQQSRIREDLRDGNRRRELLYKEYTKLETKREQLTTEHDRLAAKIWEDYELTYTAACDLGYPPVTEQTRASFGSKQTELRNKIRNLGPVNVGAIEEYADVKQRYDFNTEQFTDLTNAKESLGGIIERLEREMRVKFVTAFDEINKNFKTTFKELFGGGNAELILSDRENVLTSGIEINVAPPGKIIKNLIALSGGEQAFVAIALIFAILNVNPTPFCIFDEIESALDEVNVIRLAEYMKRYSEKTQFIAITHRRGTMEASDMLYGITMPDRGISKVLAMNVSEVEGKIGGNYN